MRSRIGAFKQALFGNICAALTAWCRTVFSGKKDKANGYPIKQTFTQKANDYPTRQTIYPQSKPLLFRKSAATAENEKNPSRKWLQSGLLYRAKSQNSLKSRHFGKEKGSRLFYQNLLPYLANLLLFDTMHHALRAWCIILWVRF